MSFTGSLVFWLNIVCTLHRLFVKMLSLPGSIHKYCKIRDECGYGYSNNHVDVSVRTV